MLTMTQLSTQETTTDNNFMQVSQLPLGVQAFLAATAAFAVVLEEEKEAALAEVAKLKEDKADLNDTCVILEDKCVIESQSSSRYFF